MFSPSTKTHTFSSKNLPCAAKTAPRLVSNLLTGSAVAAGIVVVLWMFAWASFIFPPIGFLWLVGAL